MCQQRRPQVKATCSLQTHRVGPYHPPCTPRPATLRLLVYPPPRPPWPLKSILDMQGRVSTMCSEETEAYLTCKAPKLNPTAWWT